MGSIRLASTPLLEGKGANIASAASVDLSTASGNFLHVTGTTTITSFGTVDAGAQFVLVFDGALTLSNNATISLPGGTNIATAAGDVAVMRSEGSGNWRCVSFTRANGTAVVGAEAVLTTQGDILYRGASGLARLGAGTSGQVLTTQGAPAPIRAGGARRRRGA